MKHTIWQNIDIDVDEYADFLAEQYPDVTDEDEQYALVLDEVQDILDCERMNLDI